MRTLNSVLLSSA